MSLFSISSCERKKKISNKQWNIHIISYLVFKYIYFDLHEFFAGAPLGRTKYFTTLTTSFFLFARINYELRTRKKTYWNICLSAIIKFGCYAYTAFCSRCEINSGRKFVDWDTFTTAEIDASAINLSRNEAIAFVSDHWPGVRLAKYEIHKKKFKTFDFTAFNFKVTPWHIQKTLSEQFLNFHLFSFASVAHFSPIHCKKKPQLETQYNSGRIKKEAKEEKLLFKLDNNASLRLCGRYHYTKTFLNIFAASH